MIDYWLGVNRPPQNNQIPMNSKYTRRGFGRVVVLNCHENIASVRQIQYSGLGSLLRSERSSWTPGEELKERVSVS